MKNIKEIVKLWKENVYDQSQKIDPNNECNWTDMSFGFLLAHGVDIDEAKKISVNLGYDQGIEEMLSSKTN